MWCLLALGLLLLATSNASTTEDGEFCSAKRYTQTVSLGGCQNVTIDNYYCEGRCLSGYVPDNGLRGNFVCRSCKPTQVHNKLVFLKCREGYRQTTVQIYSQCACALNNCRSNVVSPVEWTPSVYVPPCRNICRKCRKSRRRYKKLLDRQNQMELLQATCRTSACRKRIKSNVFERTAQQKMLRSKLCLQCKNCKIEKKKKKKRDNL